MTDPTTPICPDCRTDDEGESYVCNPGLSLCPLYAPSGDAQGERAHGDGTTAHRTAQGDTGGAMTEQYAAGGYVPGGETWTALDPDECLIRPPFDLPAVCTRISHPTPTSDCTVEDWIRHVSESGEKR